MYNFVRGNDGIVYMIHNGKFTGYSYVCKYQPSFHHAGYAEYTAYVGSGGASGTAAVKQKEELPDYTVELL